MTIAQNVWLQFRLSSRYCRSSVTTMGKNLALPPQAFVSALHFHRRHLCRHRHFHRRHFCRHRHKYRRGVKANRFVHSLSKELKIGLPDWIGLMTESSGGTGCDFLETTNVRSSSNSTVNPGSKQFRLLNENFDLGLTSGLFSPTCRSRLNVGTQMHRSLHRLKQKFNGEHPKANASNRKKNARYAGGRMANPA